MDQEFDFKMSLGRWKSLEDEEVIKVKNYLTGSSELPKVEIARIKDDKGNDCDNQIIASTNNPAVFAVAGTETYGTPADIYPFYLRVLHKDQISLEHQKTGKMKAYNRLK